MNSLASARARPDFWTAERAVIFSTESLGAARGNIPSEASASAASKIGGAAPPAGTSEIVGAAPPAGTSGVEGAAPPAARDRSPVREPEAGWDEVLRRKQREWEAVADPAAWAATWAEEARRAPFHLREKLSVEAWGVVFSFGELADRRDRGDGVSEEWELVYGMTQRSVGFTANFHDDFRAAVVRVARMRAHNLKVRLRRATRVLGKPFDLPLLLRPGPDTEERRVSDLMLEARYGPEFFDGDASGVPRLRRLRLEGALLTRLLADTLEAEVAVVRMRGRRRDANVARAVNGPGGDAVVFDAPRAVGCLTVALSQDRDAAAPPAAVPPGAEYGVLRLVWVAENVPQPPPTLPRFGAALLRAACRVVLAPGGHSGNVCAAAERALADAAARGIDATAELEIQIYIQDYEKGQKVNTVMVPPGTSRMRLVFSGGFGENGPAGPVVFVPVGAGSAGASASGSGGCGGGAPVLEVVELLSRRAVARSGRRRAPWRAASPGVLAAALRATGHDPALWGEVRYLAEPTDREAPRFLEPPGGLRMAWP